MLKVRVYEFTTAFKSRSEVCSLARENTATSRRNTLFPNYM